MRHSARPACERSAPQGGGGDHALGRHALGGGEQRVVGSGAHGDAEPGAQQERLGERHHPDRDAQDEKLLAADP